MTSKLILESDRMSAHRFDVSPSLPPHLFLSLFPSLFFFCVHIWVTWYVRMKSDILKFTVSTVIHRNSTSKRKTCILMIKRTYNETSCGRRREIDVHENVFFFSFSRGIFWIIYKGFVDSLIPANLYNIYIFSWGRNFEENWKSCFIVSRKSKRTSVHSWHNRDPSLSLSLCLYSTSSQYCDWI